MKKITKIEGNKVASIIKPKLRVAAYCRVSTGSDEQLVSLQAQKSHYETYIKANPEWEYVGLYYDVDTPYGQNSNPLMSPLLFYECAPNYEHPRQHFSNG